MTTRYLIRFINVTGADHHASSITEATTRCIRNGFEAAIIDQETGNVVASWSPLYGLRMV